jgi:hypothetical protein
MPGRSTVLIAIILSVAIASCAGRSSSPVPPAADTVTTAAPPVCGPPNVPGFSCTHPKVTVTPATGLRNRQRVTVRVTGFAAGGKVYLSECATSLDANPLGCGQQLAAQPFLVTGDNRAGSGTFKVSGRASATPYSVAVIHKCTDRCVLVATLGGGLRGDFAYAPISFTGHLSTAVTPAVPVVIDCLQQGQVRPRQFVFTCADALDVMTGLRWASWASAAFAAGSSWFDDCVPTCVRGHAHTFPALFVLWRPEPWPGHPGTRYFTRSTVILTGNRSYRAGGRVVHLPVVSTSSLLVDGGL